MNERIKSLLAEAHLDVMEHYGDLDSNRVAERFAELIIKDCYVALFPALRDMISRGQAYDMIKQHFGVE